MALKLAVLVGFRPKNILVEIKWEDIQIIKIDGKTIDFVFIAADNMKISRDFRQPLSEQSYKILMDIQKYNGYYDNIVLSEGNIIGVMTV